MTNAAAHADSASVPVSDQDATYLPAAAAVVAPTTSLAISTGKGILNRRKLQGQALAAAAAAAERQQAPPPAPRPSRPVGQLRYMDAQDVAKVLRACGSQLVHLGKKLSDCSCWVLALLFL